MTVGYLWSITTVLYIVCSKNILGENIPCGKPYVAKNGLHCFPCAAGYYVVSDCVRDGEQSRCRPCGLGEYIPDCDNASRCARCDLFCPHGKQEIVENCNATSNLKCQCIAGYYWKQHPHISKEGDCTKHSQCKPGEGVDRKGTPFKDTICKPCVEGITYSNSTSFDACVPCSVCNQTLSQCSATNNTVCTSGDTTSKEDGMEIWLIVVIVIAVIAVIGFLIAVFIVFVRRRGISNRPVDTTRQGNASNMENGNESNLDLNHCSENQSEIIEMNNSSFHTQSNGVDNRRAYVNGSLPLINNVDINASAHDTNHNVQEEGTPEPPKDTQYQHETGAYGKDDRCTEMATGLDKSTAECNAKQQNGHNSGITGHNKYNETNSESEFSAEDKTSDSYLESSCEMEHKSDIKDVPEQMLQKRENGDSKECERSLVYGNSDEKETTGAISNLSMDAGRVSPRIVQPKDNSMDKTVVRNEPENTNERLCSLSKDMETNIQPDNNNGQTVHGTTNRHISEGAAQNFWYEVFTFLSASMKWETFKIFYRRLVAGTNNKQMSPVDVAIDHACEECRGVKDRIYQLMEKWRQGNPNCKEDEIIDALEICKEMFIIEKLLEVIEKLKRNDALERDFVQNVGETDHCGDISGFHLQTNSNHMFELK